MNIGGINCQDKRLIIILKHQPYHCAGYLSVEAYFRFLCVPKNHKKKRANIVKGWRGGGSEDNYERESSGHN